MDGKSVLVHKHAKCNLANIQPWYMLAQQSVSYSFLFPEGHSSVNILKLLTVNLEALGAVRSAFVGREAFNVHPSSHHTEQDPFPDQLKGMWFCLQKKFFDPPEDQNFVPQLTNQG